MKAYVTHDEDGNIVSVNIPSRDSGMDIDIAPEEGQQLCEVNIAGKAEDFTDERLAAEKLLEVAREFRIEMPVAKGRLVSLRKEDETKSKGRSKAGKKAKKRSRGKAG